MQSGELNYKKAYYYLFNQMTDIGELIKLIQKSAENICTDSALPRELDIGVEKVLQSIIKRIE